MGISLNHQIDQITTDLGVLRQSDVGGFVVPNGNSTTERPSVTSNNGLIRYNTNTNKLEAVINGVYTNLISATDANYVVKSGDSMTGVFSIVAGTAALPGISFAANTSTGIYQPSSNTMGFSTSGTERMNISSTGILSISGIVGIGTTPGTYQLKVVQAGAYLAYFGSTGVNHSYVAIDNANGGLNSGIYYQNAGVNKWYVGKNYDNTFIIRDEVASKTFLTAATGGNLTLGSSENFVIDSSGNATTLTQVAGTNNTTIATTAFVTTAAAAAVPVGTLLTYSANSVPTGYLTCNGSAISRTTYSALFAVISTTYGVGDNSTTFNLPDFRGQFIRGFDAGRGVDTGRVFGSTQVHSFQTHTHGLTDPGHSHLINSDSGVAGGANWQGGYRVPASVATSTSSTGISITAPNSGNYGSETRPTNIAVSILIKY